MGNGDWHGVAGVDELADELPHGVVVDGKEVVLVRGARGASDPRAYEGRCPHRGTLLAEGEIEGTDLVCRAHGWRFDCATGERRGEPKACLRALPVKVEDGRIWVQSSASAPGETAKALRNLDDLPGPRAWPLVGNLLQVEVARLHQTLEAWARRYGPLYTFVTGTRPGIVISDPEIAESVLRARPHTYRRVGLLEPVFLEIGAQGVFSAEGAAWRPQRRLSMEALSNRNTRAFYPTLRSVAERLRGRWTKTAGEGKSVEILDDLMRFTVDVTTMLTLGTDLNTLEGGEDVLQRHLAHIFPAVTRRIMAPFPYWRWIKLPADRRLDRALVEVRRITGGLIDAARARLGALPEEARQPQNFVESMILSRDEEGKPFGDDIIHGNILTMLLAGEDTTANSLAWVVHLMCERPDVIARAREEVDGVLGEELTPQDFESASRLPYLDAVANETMRLRPVAPLLNLEANEDVVIGDVRVPRGAIVSLLTRMPTLDPTNFVDPDAFRPERWMPGEGPEGPHVAASSMPFGSGPRICPGRTLAMLEMRVVLATLLRSFEFERVGSPEAVRERFSFTMLPEDLRVRLRARIAAKAERAA